MTTALIVGATGDLGAAIAERLTKSGVEVQLWGYKSERKLADLGDRIGAVGVGVCDVRDEDAVRRAAATLPQRLDALVFAAGVNLSAETAVDTSVDDWDETFSVNVRGFFLVLRETTKRLHQAKPGRVVAISSMFALSPPARRATYAASKAALDAFVQAVAREEGGRILINSVAPSAVWSENVRSIFAKHAAAQGGDVDRYILDRLAKNPQNRFLEPDECAELVAWLVSVANTFVSGQSILIDGGEA